MLIRKIKSKENKSEVEYELLSYYMTLAQISEVLVEESKWHISPEKALKEIKILIKDSGILQ